MSRARALRIRTPEGVEFALPLAGPVSRCLALAVDLACVSLASQLVGAGLALTAAVSLDLARGLTILAYFAISVGYGIGLEWFWAGQTLGKKLLGLRVMDEAGLRTRFGQIAVRNLLRFVDLLPAFYLVGGVACLASRRAQRLGDLAASTVVVREPRLRAPDLDQLLGPRYNSLRDHPHLAARLRQRVSPEEAGIALRALLRRDELDPEARVALFAEIAAHFRSLVAFPGEATLGLADEQYVRNLVDLLFRARV